MTETKDDAEPNQTVTELVKMEDNRSLSVSHVTVTRGFSPSMAMWNSTADDPDYADLIRKHGLTKPGQKSISTRELRDDVWTKTMRREGNNW